MILIDQEGVSPFLKPRPADSHKGAFGLICIIGGAPGLAGAALLAGRAALSIGAGRVRVACLDGRVAVDPQTPELMVSSLEQALSRVPDVVAIGPGLGVDSSAQAALARSLSLQSLLILDADALNLIAQEPALASALAERPRDRTLMTPHPGEAARLLHTDARAMQEDRMAALNALVERFHCAVALKGARTLCGFGAGRVYENTTGNPGLSTAGAGDVLAGLIAGLAGQIDALDKSTLLGVYLHGLAADTLVGRGIGPIGLRASELIDEARNALNEIVYASAQDQLNSY